MEEESEPVKTLDLSNRALTHTNLRLLPASLTCLDLTRCGLEGLDSLGLLPQLELLNVSYNKLTAETFNDFVEGAIADGKTAMVRWIASEG